MSVGGGVCRMLTSRPNTHETGRFPAETKFFVMGADVPVAVLPDGTASSWYGGTPTYWSHKHLEFARREYQQKFSEVLFSEFTMLVDKSMVNIIRNQMSLKSDAGAIMIPDDFDPAAAHEELEAYNAEWGCFAAGVPTDIASVKYWLRKARAGGVPTDSYDVGKNDDDD